MKFLKLPREKPENGEEPEKEQKKIPIMEKLFQIVDKHAKKHDGSFWAVPWLDWRFNRVGLYTLSYDKSLKELHEDYIHIPKKELEHMAVHVTGEKKTWYYDTTGLERYPKSRELTAIDLEMWRRNNLIDESFLERWRRANVDIKKMITYIIIAVVCIGVGIAYMGNMTA